MPIPEEHAVDLDDEWVQGYGSPPVYTIKYSNCNPYGSISPEWVSESISPGPLITVPAYIYSSKVVPPRGRPNGGSSSYPLSYIGLTLQGKGNEAGGGAAGSDL